jgi:hypothetical protein
VNSPRQLQDDLLHGCRRLSVLVAEAEHPEPKSLNLHLLWQQADRVELILIDEADWLKTITLEQVRAIYDQRQIGLILIGMPGMEKRLSGYPQLYSRVGFVHHFAPSVLPRPAGFAASLEPATSGFGAWRLCRRRGDGGDYPDDER